MTDNTTIDQLRQRMIGHDGAQLRSGLQKKSRLRAYERFERREPPSKPSPQNPMHQALERQKIKARDADKGHEQQKAQAERFNRDADKQMTEHKAACRGGPPSSRRNAAARS